MGFSASKGSKFLSGSLKHFLTRLLLLKILQVLHLYSLTNLPHFHLVSTRRSTQPFFQTARDTRRTTTITTSSSQKHHTTFMMAQSILRILVIVLTAVSVLVTVTNNQTVTLYTFQFEAHFYYSPSLKFFVAANSVVCFLSVSLLLFNLLRRRQQTHQLKDYYFFLFLFDLVMTVLLIAGCAAATAVGFVGQYGEDHVGWTPICDNVKNFCINHNIPLYGDYYLIFYFTILFYF